MSADTPLKLPDILADDALRQHEFPVVAEKIFMAHAAVCPLPRRVTKAMNDFLVDCSFQDQEMAIEAGLIRELRRMVAQVIHAEPGEIALVGPTSLALSLVASGLPWKAGDNVLVYREDYPSNVYPWMALAERGVEVRYLEVDSLGRITVEQVARQVDDRTRLAALASCHFISGYRIDLADIGAYLHSKGVAFCVDAIQTLGAFPTSSQEVDYLAADAHKWLLGPCSAGVLFVQKDRQDELRPPVYGWHNVRCPEFVAQEELVLRSDARRYEAGTANLVGLVGLKASLQMLMDIGLDTITRELQRKRQWLVPALQKKGYAVLHADLPPENAGGVVAFNQPGRDMGELHQTLSQAGIISSLRTDRQGHHYLRFSPHFYNTDEELHRVLELL